MATMSITIPEQLVEMINEKVKSGMYHTASDVIGEGLQLLREQDAIRLMRLEALRKELAIAEKQLENGEVTEYASGGELADKIIAEGDRILASRRKAVA